jgi:hypothetical protein
MNKAVSIGLVIVGVLLIIFGVNANHSFSSNVSRTFTGSPTDKAIWLLTGGIIAAVIGLAGLFRDSK